MSGAKSLLEERCAVLVYCQDHPGATLQQILAAVEYPATRLVHKMRFGGYLTFSGKRGERGGYRITPKGMAHKTQLLPLVQTLREARTSGSAIVGHRGPVRGPCPQCGVFFRSHHPKQFCSMNCLSQSPGYRERMREQSLRALMVLHEKTSVSELQRVTLQCLQCGKAFARKPSLKHQRFCGKVCYRLYMAGRFDRWIANPQSIALPQAFDEFLTAEELPCLIEGCGWRGLNLGNHVNFTHGISANEFKKLAGFNKTTGLVTPEVHEKISVHWKEIAARYSTAEHMAMMKHLLASGKRAEFGRSLEAQEHRVKARELLISDSPVRESPCRLCGKPCLQPPLGRRWYCNSECRQRYYEQMRIKPQIYEMRCNWCNAAFLGNRGQHLRQQKGLAVCCSQQCRNVRNIVIALKKTGKRFPTAGMPPSQMGPGSSPL